MEIFFYAQNVEMLPTVSVVESCRLLVPERYQDVISVIKRTMIGDVIFVVATCHM